MAKSCPISGEFRDEHAVRTVAAIVTMLALTAIMARGAVGVGIMVALAIDFAIRGFGEPRFSLLARVAQTLVRALRLTPKTVDAAPKRFAARIGLGFATAAATLFLLQALTAAIAVAAVLAICAFLESAFAFCLGCRIYALLPRRV